MVILGNRKGWEFHLKISNEHMLITLDPMLIGVSRKVLLDHVRHHANFTGLDLLVPCLGYFAAMLVD